MVYRVDLSARAARDLDILYRRLQRSGPQAIAWFDGLEQAILSLSQTPDRCPPTPEDDRFRHLLFGSRRDVYRVIFKVDDRAHAVTILTIRHGAQQPI